MKKKIILLFTLFCLNMAFAQTKVELQYTKDKKVLLNNEAIDKKTDLKTIQSILGEPFLFKQYPSGKTIYYYSELGLAVHFMDKNLLFVGASFNWDGDNSFPETSYTGSFKVGEVELNKETQKSTLSEIEVVEIKCIFPSMCMSDPKKEKDVIIIGFKDEKITQAGFEFR